MACDTDGSNSKAAGSIHQRTIQQSDDLVSITVRKSEPNQKAGISLVERQGSVYVTKITEHGLFHLTEVEIGDHVLSINGKRLGKGEGAREIVKHIASAKSKVTMVVKKASRKPRRGSRSLSPRSYRKKRGSSKLYKEASHRNPDGSLKIDIDPRVENFKQKEDDGKDQIPIAAKKLFPNQEVGVFFKEIDKMVFVSGIALDSIFYDTELALGDRIVSVNDLNFMSYADAVYARKLAQKAKVDVTLVVEKNHKNFNPKTDVDRGHNILKESPKLTIRKSSSSHHRRSSLLSKEELDDSDSSDDSEDMLTQILTKAAGGVVEKEKDKKSKAGKPIRLSKSRPAKPTRSASATEGAMPDASPLDSKGRKAGKSASHHSKTKKTTTADDNSSESSLEDDFERSRHSNGDQSRSHHGPLSSSDRFQASLNGSLKWEDYDGDYMKVTVRKKSMDEPGISLVKSEGKFILTELPEHEKRISVGMQVLAINGVANLNTVIKADDLIKRSPVVVVLNIAFNEPVENNWRCPCCDKPMNAEGYHSEDRMTAGKTTIAGFGVGRTGTRHEDGSTVSSVVGSLSDSVTTASTAVVNNKAPPGQRLPKAARGPHHHLYNFDDFDSDDSDADDAEAGKAKAKPSRPSIAKHSPNDRFMVRVSKKGESPGITFFDYKGQIYVLNVANDSPFYTTAINKGDKVLSINGRKVGLIKTAANALTIIGEKKSLSIFALRPDPEDEGYKEVLAHFPN